MKKKIENPKTWEEYIKDLDLKKISRVEMELIVRKLAEINLGEYPKNHFSPEDHAFIRCLFKDYIIKYFWPIIEKGIREKNKA